MTSDILHSWKSIAAYLEKDVRTCSRWARELELPVHRVNGESSRSKVFAYRAEIDEWLRNRPAGGTSANARRRTAGRRFLIPGAAAAGVLTILAAWFIFKAPGRAGAAGPSIAVAPFENLNPAAPDDYLTEGIANEVANRLSAYGRVSLIPAAAVPDFRQEGEARDQIRTRLGADYLLKGQVRKTGESVHMRFEVFRIRDTARVLNLEFDETLGRLPFVIDSLRNKIAETLGLPAPSAEALMTAGAAPAPAALDDVLKGRYLLQRLNAGERKDPWSLYHQGRYFSGRAAIETNEIAISLFEQAVEADAGFADAYTGLADCYMNYINRSWDLQKKWLDKAEALLQNARALSPNDPESLASLVKLLLLQDIQFSESTRQEAYALAEAGLAKYPQHSRINSVAGAALYRRFGETGSEEDFRRALACKEKSFWMNMYSIQNLSYSELLMLNRDFDRALAVCEAIRAVEQGKIPLFRMSEIYYFRGELDRSEALLDRLPESNNERQYALQWRGMIAARRGRADEAAGFLKKILLLQPPGRTEHYRMDEIGLASICIGMGERARGLAYLREFFSREDVASYRHVYLKWIAIDPNFDSVRDTPEFKTILQGGASI